jgi:hypothetical protein
LPFITLVDSSIRQAVFTATGSSDFQNPQWESTTPALALHTLASRRYPAFFLGTLRPFTIMATDPRIIHNPFRKVGAGIIASAALQHAGDSSSAAASESTQQPESHFSEFFNRVFNGVRRFYLWPSIFAFAVGYKVGIKAALKQIATATTRRTTEVVVSGPLITIRSFLLKAALLALITREFWRVIPAWVKRQLPFVGEPKKTIELEDPNDLSSITALSLKLQRLFH